jgi:pimeloyl-ACP methyl ester carboxylesterase
MDTKQLPATKRMVHTASGRIAYTEQGQGPVALFVHGVLLNAYLWRHQVAHLSDMRRCIAPDLLAHGDTEITPHQDVSVTANASMLEEFLDALSIDQVDLVGNDSGGGIAQIFAASNPQRVRSLTLTDCDAHDNWPPDAFKPFLTIARGAGPGVRTSRTRHGRNHRNLFASAGRDGTAYARLSTVPRSLRQQAHAGDRGTTPSDEGTNVDRVGNRRRVFRSEVVAVVGCYDPGNETPGRARRSQDLFPRGAVGGIQPGTPCTLAGRSSRSR